MFVDAWYVLALELPAMPVTIQLPPCLPTKQHQTLPNNLYAVFNHGDRTEDVG